MAKKNGKGIVGFIDENGFDYKYIAGKMGISEKLLLKKLLGKTELRVDEAIKLIGILGIKDEEVDDILFDKFCETQESGAE